MLNLSDVRLIVATPCHGDNCDSVYVTSILKLQKLCLQNNIHIEFFIPPGNSDIAHSRNKMVYELMNKANFTHMIFIDADIGFDAIDVIKMIQADVDVICGIYSKKYIDWGSISEAAKKIPPDELKYFTSPYVVKLVDGMDYSKVNPDEPVEIEHCGTGMMMIKRNVFNTIAKYTNTYLSWDDEIPPNKSLIYEFFCFYIEPETGYRISEDVYFCKQWRKHGGKIYAAPWMKMKHVGKYSFESNLWR